MKQSENGDNGDVVTFRERFPYRPGQVHRDDIPDEVVDTWRSRSGWDQWFPPQDLDPKWEDAYWHTMNRDLTEEERENGWRITETEYGKIYRQEEINGETDEQPLNRPPPELDDGEEVVITPRGLVRVRAEVDGVSATASKGSTISILENNRVKWALGMFAHHPQLRDLLLIGDREDPVRQAFRLSTHFIPTVPQVLEQFDYGECARVWRAFVERHRAGRDLDAMGVVSDVNPIERSYEPVVPNELWQLFDEIYDPPEYADGDPDEARQWIIRHVLRPALVEWPLRCAVERNEGVTSQVIEWSTRIEAAFETHLEQAGESHGPFTTDQFRQQTEDREELVSGVLVANQLGLVAAATKSMKTTCMVDMAISLATSTPWLGNETWQCCEPKRVFFCSAESGQETLIHKHDVISNVKRAMLPVDQQSRFDCLLADNLLWDSHLPDLGDAGALERFAKVVGEHSIDVVILDPLSLAVGSAANDLPNLAVGGQVILRAAAAFRRVGATLVLVHHTSGDRMRQQAGRGNGPLELHDAAYPSIANHVRQWILLSRAEPYDVAGGRRSVLWLRIGGSGLQAGGDFRATIIEGHDHHQWDVRIESQAQYIEGETARRAIQAEEERQDHVCRLLEYLRANPGATENLMITETTSLQGMGRQTLRPLLRDLRSRGAIRVEEVGRSRRYFAIYENGEQIDADRT